MCRARLRGGVCICLNATAPGNGAVDSDHALAPRPACQVQVSPRGRGWGEAPRGRVTLRGAAGSWRNWGTLHAPGSRRALRRAQSNHMQTPVVGKARYILGGYNATKYLDIEQPSLLPARGNKLFELSPRSAHAPSPRP